MDDWLDSEEFYDAMECYRNTPVGQPFEVVENFKNMKQLILQQSSYDQYEIKVLRNERDRARAQVDCAVKLMSGIYSLMYPAPVTTADGHTRVFRPINIDPHEVLQELSDRIRALPAELAKLTTTSSPDHSPEGSHTS
jgi:hypothetical protein